MVKISKETKIQYILLSIGLIIMIYYVLSSHFFDNLQSLNSIHIFSLLAGLLLSILSIFIKIIRWTFLCNKYNTHITLKDATIANISGYFYSNVTPGKIGDIYKAYFMNRTYNMQYKNGISILFYERFIELILLFLIGCSAILIITFDEKILLLIGLMATILTIITISYKYYDKTCKIVKYVVGKTRFSEKFNNIDLEISKLNHIDVFIAFLLTFISLSLEFSRLWIIASAFGVNVNIIIISGMFCISVIIGLISQIPLGIGITEITLAQLFESIGVNSEISTSIVLIDRLLSIYFCLFIGFIFSKISINRISEVKK